MSEQSILTVTQLNKFIKVYIDSQPLLRSVKVKGEISNLKMHSSGHIYFTLKEGRSLLAAVMFRQSAEKMVFKPENGLSVVCSGRISVYEDAGQYQLYVTSMEADGIGELYIAFDQLKRKLSAQGLFDASLKRRIPGCPHRVGVITSPTGAAVRDIIKIGTRRFPAAAIVLYPSLVQGAEAAPSLIEGIEYFNSCRTDKVDVIIIGRGGGSIEDLWAFNDESLARAVRASHIPVVSAVGHETDFTICDFAADARASTPSAAAEICFPDSQKFREKLDNVITRMRNLITVDINAKRRHTADIASRRVMTSPYAALEDAGMKVMQYGERLERAAENMLGRKKLRLSAMSARLPLLNPYAPLERGYAVVEKEGKAVSSVSQVTPGEKLRLKMKDGTLGVLVEERELEG